MMIATTARDLNTLLVPQFSSRPAVVASFVIGSSLVLFFGLLPAVLGGLASEGVLTEAGVGQLMTVEMLALAFAAASGQRLMRGHTVRVTIALVGLVVVNIVAWWTSSVPMLYVVRIASGILGGLAFCAAMSVQMHTPRPERTNAAFFAFSALPQITVGYLVPAQVIPVWGASAGYLILAGAFTLSLFFVRLMHSSYSEESATRSLQPSSALRNVSVIILLAAILLHNAGTGAGWTYVPLIGAEKGFSPETIGLAIGGGLAASLMGSLFFASVAWRFPALPGLVLGLSLQATVATGLATLDDNNSYITASLVFSFLWMVLQPFYVGPAVALDPSRRLATSLFGIGLAGMAVGPFIASTFVTEGASRNALFVTTACLAIGALVYGLLLLRLRRQKSSWLE